MHERVVDGGVKYVGVRNIYRKYVGVRNIFLSPAEKRLFDMRARLRARMGLD